MFPVYPEFQSRMFPSQKTPVIPLKCATVYTGSNEQHKPQQKALCEARKSPWCIVGNLLMWNLSCEAPRCSTTAQSDSDAKQLYHS